jgi:hypothetical protein
VITRRGLFGGPLAVLPLTRKDKPVTSYLPCAGSPISLPAAADTTGRNPGNLTNAFTTNVLGVMPPIWEWYHAVVATQDPTKSLVPAQCGIYVNLLKPVTFTYPVSGTEYDPSQPVQFRQGDELFFFWQLASSVTPVPVVTMFLRYDADLPANRPFRGA